MLNVSVSKGEVTISNTEGSSRQLMAEAACVVKAVAKAISLGDAAKERDLMGWILDAMISKYLIEGGLLEAESETNE